MSAFHAVALKCPVFNLGDNSNVCSDVDPSLNINGDVYCGNELDANASTVTFGSRPEEYNFTLEFEAGEGNSDVEGFQCFLYHYKDCLLGKQDKMKIL